MLGARGAAGGAVVSLAHVYTRAVRAEAAAGQWAATERGLYLAAVDVCVRVAPDASAPMVAAHRAMRALLRAEGAALYAEHALDGRTAVRWTEALRTVIGLEVDAIAARLDCDRGAVDRRDLRAALLMWAAVEAWGEGRGPWLALAAAGAALASALDGAVDDGAGGLVTGGAARRVRAAGQRVWREMER
jgi:hypothetical protein